MPYEPIFKICSNCHVAILQPHPEESLAQRQYFKCPICGYTVCIPKPKYDYILNKFLKKDD